MVWLCICLIGHWNTGVRSWLETSLGFGPPVLLRFGDFLFSLYYYLHLGNHCCWFMTIKQPWSGRGSELWWWWWWLYLTRFFFFCLHWKSPQHGNITTGMTNSDTTINECLYPSGVYYRGYEEKSLGAGMKLLVQYFGCFFWVFLLDFNYNIIDHNRNRCLSK